VARIKLDRLKKGRIMNNKKMMIAMLVSALCLLLPCADAWAWQRNIGPGWASAVAVDAAGNVVAAGTTSNDFTVAKFDGATGQELWRRVIDGSDSSFGQASAVAIDAAGNVVAAGSTSNDFTVAKFDGATGADLWRQNINGSANGYDSANAVAVDAAGNVVAAGHTEIAGIGGVFTVIKFNGASGAELWRQEIRGGGDSSGAEAHLVAVDSASNVVAAGNLNVGCGFWDYGCTTHPTVIKLSGVNGAELWRKGFEGSASEPDWVNAVVVDAAGDVVAAGATNNLNTGLDFTVIKFNGVNGAELWRRDINGTWDQASSVAVDSAGNVVAAGLTISAGTFEDFTVIKFNGVNGAEIWRQNINGTALGSDFAGAAAVDAAGNVVAAGSTRNNGTGTDFTVIKFDGASGQELWRQSFSGSSGFEHAAAVAVDTAGNVAAAGSVGSEFTVVKLPGTPTQLSGLTADVISPQNLGTSVTFTANATDGFAPLQYKWWVFSGGVWSVLKDWSTSSSFTWTAGVGGSYRIGVWVKSSGNPVDYPEGNAYNSIPFDISFPPALTLTGISSDQVSPQPAGSTITFTATTSGGLAPHQYKWWMFNGVAWSVVQDWSSSSSFNWTAGVGGNYRIGVWVKSSGNPADAPEGSAYNSVPFDISFPPALTLTGISSDLVSPQAAGSTIVFTAATSGGLAPLQYKWWVFSGGVWSVLKDWSGSSSFALTAGFSGSYLIGVWVKSSGNAVDYPEGNAYNSVAFTIN
jgi:hypothetical protein